MTRDKGRRDEELVPKEEEILNWEDDSFMTGVVDTSKQSSRQSDDLVDEGIYEQEDYLENGDEDVVQLDEDGLLPEERELYESQDHYGEADNEVNRVERNRDRVNFSNPFDIDDLDSEQELQMIRAKAQARKKLNIIITSLSVILLGCVIAWIVFAKPFSDKAVEKDIPKFETQAVELINLMYNANGIEDLASANPTIVSYFDDSIKDSFDIRDSNVYAQRYSYFHNAPIKVTVNELHQSDSTVVIRYTVECEVSSPLMRIAILNINTEGKITDFEEYNTY